MSSIIMDDASLDQRIATRLRDLRAMRGLTLDALAERSGVSRSMISVIERGESSPTAALLEKLAAGLGVSLASLFDPPAPSGDPVARRAEQPQWRDPASGYVRRNVSPAGVASPIQIVEVEFPAGAHVAFDSGARDTRVHQQVWVLDGAVEVSVGDERHQLRAGDCFAFVLDRPTAFRNRSRRKARYAVVIVGQPAAAR
ncbi:MAG: helix-turn-helix transcriptional regulator [Alphaproteobacteria bacterium]|nr:helix-turn-helix transcriptional regulator [Alphaproteobacteria bacterium]MCW5740062.1 helix-turn-helix transcriptional regulator [Alphaproteobacteria bacterium]